VFNSGNYEPNVVAMFTQVCPGKPFTGINKNKRFKNDTEENRKLWFEQCLKKLSDLKPTSLALPHRFGCYRNGADWNEYSDKIQEFADQQPRCLVLIYQDTKEKSV
jgi:hypothetical protein